VYLSELLKAYLKVSSLALMEAVLKATHLAELIQTLKESRRDLHLDLRITLLMVLCFEVLWVHLSESGMA